MPIEDGDRLLLNRNNATYTVLSQNLMADIATSDLFLVNRGNATYTANGQELKDFFKPQPAPPSVDAIALSGGPGFSGQTYTTTLTNYDEGFFPAQKELKVKVLGSISIAKESDVITQVIKGDQVYSDFFVGNLDNGKSLYSGSTSATGKPTATTSWLTILEDAAQLSVVMNNEIAVYWGGEGRGVDYELQFTDGATSTYSGSIPGSAGWVSFPVKSPDAGKIVRRWRVRVSTGSSYVRGVRVNNVQLVDSKYIDLQFASPDGLTDFSVDDDVVQSGTTQCITSNPASNNTVAYSSGLSGGSVSQGDPFDNFYANRNVNTTNWAANPTGIGCFGSTVNWVAPDPIYIDTNLYVYAGAYNNTSNSWICTCYFSDGSEKSFSGNSGQGSWNFKNDFSSMSGKFLTRIVVDGNGNYSQLCAVAVDETLLINGANSIQLPNSTGLDVLTVGSEVTQPSGFTGTVTGVNRANNIVTCYPHSGVVSTSEPLTGPINPAGTGRISAFLGANEVRVINAANVWAANRGLTMKSASNSSVTEAYITFDSTTGEATGIKGADPGFANAPDDLKIHFTDPAPTGNSWDTELAAGTQIQTRFYAENNEGSVTSSWSNTVTGRSARADLTSSQNDAYLLGYWRSFENRAAVYAGEQAQQARNALRTELIGYGVDESQIDYLLDICESDSGDAALLELIQNLQQRVNDLENE